MPYNNIFVSVQGQILRTSPKAIEFKVACPDGSFLAPEWFPRSQLSSAPIEAYDEIEGTFDILMASEWIVGQKKLTAHVLAQKAGLNGEKKSFLDTPEPPAPYASAPKPAHNPVFSDMDDDIPF